MREVRNRAFGRGAVCRIAQLARFNETQLRENARQVCGVMSISGALVKKLLRRGSW